MTASEVSRYTSGVTVKPTREVVTTLDEVPVDQMLAEIERRAEAARHDLSPVSSQNTDGLVRTYLDGLTLSGYRPATLRARKFVLAAFARTITARDLAQATHRDVTA